LSEEDQSYTSLAHEASMMVARRMLAVERRSIQETAFALGFSEVSSFHRVQALDRHDADQVPQLSDRSPFMRL
jgi:AraC-like DNA-binding protein